MIRYLISSILCGVFATLLMDVAAMLVRASGLTAGLPPTVLGKWFTYLLRGRLIHIDILSSPEIPIRMPLVLAIHYGIGIALASVFVALCRWQAAQRGTFSFALGFGLLTTDVPLVPDVPRDGLGRRRDTRPGRISADSHEPDQPLVLRVGVGAMDFYRDAVVDAIERLILRLRSCSVGVAICDTTPS